MFFRQVFGKYAFHCVESSSSNIFTQSYIFFRNKYYFISSLFYDQK